MKNFIRIAFLILISILFYHGIGKAQIINIEQKRIITDTVGFAGDLGLSVNASKYSASYFAFTTDGHLQYKSHRHLVLLYGNYSIINVNGDEFNRNGFAHLRYNYEVNDLVRLEAFIQTQQNALLLIKRRDLNGLGVRFKLSQYENAKFYYGITIMRESEILSIDGRKSLDSRASSYFTFTLSPQETVRLSNTSYIQPLVKNMSDFRFSNDLSLSFKITKNIQFSTTFHYLYDSKPPADIPSGNYEVTNGLAFSF